MSGDRPWHPLRIVRPDVPAEVDEEIDFHIEMRARELAASGLPPDEARREAARVFGDLGGIRDECITIDRRRLQRDGRREASATFHSVP